MVIFSLQSCDQGTAGSQKEHIKSFREHTFVFQVCIDSIKFATLHTKIFCTIFGLFEGDPIAKV